MAQLDLSEGDRELVWEMVKVQVSKLGTYDIICKEVFINMGVDKAYMVNY